MTSKKQLRDAADERALISTEKTTFKKVILLILGIISAGVIRAVAIYLFVVPNNFAPGGITGIATMLENKLPGHPNAGWFLLAMNVPLVIIAFIFIGKRFGIISGGAILLSSGLMILFEKIGLPTFDLADNKILAAMAGGIIGGVGVALMLKLGGSNGGTDIIAALIQKKFSATNIAWYIFLVDSSVVLVSFFVYDNSIVPVLLSMVEMYASSKVAETILQGFKSAVKFEIITTQPEELSAEIIQKLHRGVTKIAAKGMYTGEERAMLICILRKRQMSAFREILKKYPDTFAYITSASEVVGRGFTK